MLDLGRLCRECGIEPRGVIHVGAHEGQELARYNAIGFSRVLFIEANPVVYQRLCQNVSTSPHVKTVNVAISNQNGKAQLRVMSFDQSSSILPLKRHKHIYPSITEQYQITVPTKTLDTLCTELQLNDGDYNVLIMDIQGAELLALQGAANLLAHIEAIHTEVNFEELYENCARIEQIDAFLQSCQFTRIETATPYHSSWGDAFYAKRCS
ncbi:FkbM family methyltransferase [Brevibacillus sp. GCM10020057]|uniref:FkbM family methyltransferase n=1 Tax=Brevibacillus sp. GCM10020057 TaxID=3317327 RepID=UPI003637D3BD